MPVNPSFTGIKACVFDAYGTLFDVHSAVAQCRGQFPDPEAQADRTSEIWRTRQLQYSWLRALQNRHVDFWQVTGDALDFALESVLGNLGPAGLRDALLNSYLTLDAYPEVLGVLKNLRDSGLKTAILSNGSPEMLERVCDKSGVGALMDAVLSVEEVGIYKPHPSVYQLAVDRLGVHADSISFQSSNAWDATAASAFGFRVAWINRFSQAPERLPGKPDAELRTLDELPPLLGN
ncbi:haloacid dehalogenase type II [uncultured Nisaea sp.]|jgi:2-haloacid dehalogenase|uniref:haloacid dehalogenase type II n=1 Tax=uncultured Nisaea sp. TaxID=538215 RepID=UPI0030EF9CF4